MRKKTAIINMYLMTAVLFTILFQSLHTYRHVVADFFEDTEPCEHVHDGFSHQQHADDECPVCDFTLWYYVKPPLFNYRLYFPIRPVPYLYKEAAPVSSFSGALFSRRGPPQPV